MKIKVILTLIKRTINPKMYQNAKENIYNYKKKYIIKRKAKNKDNN